MKRIALLLILATGFKGISQKQNTHLKDSLNTPKIITERLSPIMLSGTTGWVADKQSPVPIDNIKVSEIKLLGGGKDLPEYLNTLPGVYTTKGGGGVGDSQITLRGFSQRNIAVLINGVPVNDMETGWVYWSNWIHLPEIASDIQVQAGLGASKLAIPSVGGTINILTAAARKAAGSSVSYQYVSSGMYKEALAYHTGLLPNGLSMAIRFGHFHGDGYVDMTQFSGYDYYINAMYQPNDRHRFMFNLIGAPQWHNQRNIAPTLKDYLQYGSDNTPNIKYNSEWGILQGKPYTWSRNFFHKPLASLNWNWQLTDDLQLSSVLYAAWGRGGGTGPVGAINYHYPGDSIFTNTQGQIRFDDIYTWNSGGLVPDFGMQRQANAGGLYVNDISNGLTRYAFINNHAWYGSIFNLSYQSGQYLTFNAGLDLRTTSGKNTLTVNDVLGADAYFDFFDVNHPNRLITPEKFVPATYDWNALKSIDDLKKIIFYDRSKVRWLGIFVKAKYQYQKWQVFMQGSWSLQSFQKTDYFNFPPENQVSQWVDLPGGNIKTGVGYQINNRNYVYANTGYFSKQPLFKAVFTDGSGLTPQKNLHNEHIYAVECGYQLATTHWKLRLNAYYTSWQNRYEQVNDYIQNQPVSGILSGVEEVHKGVALTAKAKYGPWRIVNMFSLGNWYYKGNITDVTLYNNQHLPVATRNYYLDGVKVGNAAWFTGRLAVRYKMSSKLELWASQFYVDRLYANIDAGSFSSPNHQGSLRLPAYSLIDAGIKYRMKIRKLGTAIVHAGIQNLMNKKYIAQSETNIIEGGQQWQGVDLQNRVYFGWGRTFSFSVDFKF